MLPYATYSQSAGDHLPAAYSTFEQDLLTQGLVDVQSLNPDIRVILKYGDSSNFMRANVYGDDLKHCFLQKSAAQKLAVAGRILKIEHPDLALLVVDGLRPRHIQHKMWDIVRNTPMRPYVANPAYGSMHNYGCAVDITLIDSLGNRLDMGTPMDHFGALAQPRMEMQFLGHGELTAESIANRKILRDVMVKAGFHPIPVEWWHFDAFDKKAVRAQFRIVE